jgi:diadenosine tetraphosphatase ApaH/serine/threonine PP2A family protein phosphatase
LTEENQAYLRGLDAGPLIVDDLTEICHGSPADEDTYIFADADAAEGLTFARRPACFFGHTHLPTALTLSPERELQVILQGGGDHPPIALAPGGRYLINPGSVGQPRDGDRRAAYALLETAARQVTLARVAYPVERAHDRILQPASRSARPASAGRAPDGRPSRFLASRSSRRLNSAARHRGPPATRIRNHPEQHGRDVRPGAHFAHGWFSF